MQVRRREFTDNLSRRGQIDVRRMSPNLRSELTSRGVSDEDLRSIAGSDHVIRGAEFGRLYDRLFDAERSGAAGRTGDLGRADRLYGLLQREATAQRLGATSSSSSSSRGVGLGTRSDAPRPSDSTRSVGLGARTSEARPGDAGPRSPEGARANHEGHVHGGGASAHLDVSYGSFETPEVDPDVRPPEDSNWFMEIIEFLFGWLGMETDGDRLEEHGQRLADEYGSEIEAFQRAYMQEHGGRTMSNGIGVPTEHVQRQMKQELVDHIAARMEAQGVSPEESQDRARIVVDAMFDRIEANHTRDGATAADQGLPAADTRYGEALGARVASARRSAERIASDHPEWGARIDAALRPPADDHPWIAANPDRAEEVSAVVMAERVETIEYLMAMQQAGELDNVPDSLIDSMLGAHEQYLASGRAVSNAAAVFDGLSESQRTELTQAIEGVPEDQRMYAAAALALEYGALTSSDPEEVTGAIRRVRTAAQQLEGTSNEDARSTLDRGVLGLERTEMTLDYGRGQRVDIPVYFHPSVSEADREAARGLIQEAYGHMPYHAMQAVAAGEGGQPFSVQVLPNGSFNAGGSSDPDRPSGDENTWAFYKTRDNQIRMNMSLMSHALEGGDDAERQRVVTMILHETVHDLDDLGDADNDQGFFIHHHADRARERERISGDGDLAPTWAHVARTRSRFDDVSTNVGDDPQARRYYTLSRNDSRTPEQDAELTRLGAHLAARSGTTTPYSATGGDGDRSIAMGEWWAETFSRYLNPTQRDHLRSVDPVAHQAAQRYAQALERGTPPADAMREALRFSLATDVSADQGVAMLSDAPRSGLTDETLNDLDLIGRAFEDHATALQGWQPYQNDAGLISTRETEARDAMSHGRGLLTAIQERRGALASAGQQGGAEDQRLAALETSLARSLTRLEQAADSMGSDG